MSTRWATALLTITLTLTLGAGCHSAESPDATPSHSATEAASAPIQPAPVAAPAPHAAAAGMLRGTVVETMDSGGYTYVQVDTGSQRVWAAAPQVAVAVGAKVSFDGSMPMTNYRSASLDRTFERIYFTGAIELDAPTPAAVPVIAAADGGVTVEQVFARRADLVGTEIVIRGQVVKFNAGILGKNWLHIQDGSGADGTNDLTVTTAATAAVGDTVLARGVLAADKDFGYGYVYDLIVEDAQITLQ